MKDSWGDGWNGGQWSWCSDDGACSTGTLESGASGTTTLCTTGCETLAVGGGDYPSEVSWTLSDGSSGEGAGEPHDMCAPSAAPSMSMAPSMTLAPTKGERYLFFFFKEIIRTALPCTHAHH